MSPMRGDVSVDIDTTRVQPRSSAPLMIKCTGSERAVDAVAALRGMPALRALWLVAPAHMPASNGAALASAVHEHPGLDRLIVHQGRGRAGPGVYGARGEGFTLAHVAEALAGDGELVGALRKVTVHGAAAKDAALGRVTRDTARSEGCGGARWTDARAEDALALALALRSPACGLEDLALKTYALCADGERSLAWGLRGAHSLRRVCLGLAHTTRGGIDALCSALGASPALQVLTWRLGGVADNNGAAAASLARMVRSNETLRELNLHNCGDEVAHAVGDALETAESSCVQSLGFHSATLSDEGAIALERAVERTPRVQAFYHSDSLRLTDVGVEALSRAVEIARQRAMPAADASGAGEAGAQQAAGCDGNDASGGGSWIGSLARSLGLGRGISRGT